MKTDKWAVTLNYQNKEQLEDRVALIAEYLEKQYGIAQWTVADLDATGPLGDCLTQQLNDETILRISSTKLIDLLKDGGQVIELRAIAAKDGQALFQIIVRHGQSIDVLGTSEQFPVSILGEHYNQDVSLFMW